MHKFIAALMLGTFAAATAVPALAQDDSARQIGERLRGRVAEDRDDRREERRERREERREAREQRWEERRDDRADRDEDRREARARWEEAERRRWEAERRYGRGYGYGRDYGYDRRYDDRDPYGFRYNGTPWNRDWTPYGFGYNDSFTRDWVFRNFADRNRNGRISEKEWRRAQDSFYRLADRNRDGRISRGEYDWAMRALRYNYGSRW